METLLNFGDQIPFLKDTRSITLLFAQCAKEVSGLSKTQTEIICLHSDKWMDSPETHIVSMNVATEGDITIDASESGPVPAQVAQILLAAQRTAIGRGAKLNIENPSEAVVSSLETLGLSDLLLGAVV